MESYFRAVETAARIVTHRLWVSSRRYLGGDGMSITTGVTGGGSYSNRWTEQAFPRSGLGYTSRGRGNLNLVGFATNRELALGLVLLGLAGPAGAVARGVALRGLNVVTKPVFWVGVNAYQEAEDAAAWVRGEDMSWQFGMKVRPVRHPVFGSWGPGIPAIPVPFPYLDFTKSPSSGGGGPGEIPNLHRPPPSIEETGEILSNPPIAGGIVSSTTSKGRSTGRCPYHWRYRGHKDRRGWDRGYWTLHYPRGPRCVLRKGHSGPHRK